MSTMSAIMMANLIEKKNSEGRIYMPNKCNNCRNYVMIFSPILKKKIMTCKLTKRNVGCKGNYKEK